MVNILNKFNRSAGKRAKLMDWILNEIRLGRLKKGMRYFSRGFWNKGLPNTGNC